MTTSRALGVALLAASLALVAIEHEAGAFAVSGARAASATIVSAGSAFHAVKALTVHGSSALGYADQAAIIVWNNGTAGVTFRYSENADAQNAMSSFTDCASTTTAVGKLCTVRFSGPSKINCNLCSFTVSGTVLGQNDAGANDLSTAIRSVQVTVLYCPLPPCG